MKTLNQYFPKTPHPKLFPKLLNFYKTAYTSTIPTNGTFLEMSGQGLEVPMTSQISTELHTIVIPF